MSHNNNPVPPGDCLLFATADWDTPYWTNKQHTAHHLAQAGWRVLYVESVGLRQPRMGSGTDWGRLLKRLWRGLRGPRQVQERVWVLSPLVLPFKHHHPWVRAFNQGRLSRTLARFCQEHGFKSPMVWTYHPFVLESLQRLQQRHQLALGPTVYHCVDDLAAIPGIDAAAFNAEEQRLLQHCQVVFTTSPSLADKCSAHHPRVHNFPNVVDVDHFAQAWRQDGPLPADLAAIPEPRLAYLGALSDFKVDFELLDALAAANPQWSLVLIGDEREGQHNPTLARMVQRPNVHLLGHRPYVQLPHYLRGMRVGLLPTLVNDYTRSMFPMKYFEYLAAGLPVVSTPLPFTKEGIHNYLGTAAYPVSFSEKIRDTLLRVSSKHAIAEEVRDNTWSKRLDKMLKNIFIPTPKTYMSKTITVQDVGIYEPIYLNGQTISQDNFIPLLHTSNKHFANWREFRIHVEMFRNRVFENHAFTGLFSPKFELKTKITGIEFAQFCANNADADVIFINPFPQLAYMSFNIWMQAEANHSGIIEIAKNLLNDAEISLTINTEQRHCHEVLSYSSFWCGNAKFWNYYVGTILLPLANFIEKNPNAPSVRAAFNETFHTDPSPYLPFITERLFTTYISQQHDLILKHYPLNPIDYCLNQNEIDFVTNTRQTLDEADKLKVYPPSIKETLQLACNKSAIEAKEFYKKNVHPHTGRIIN